MNINEQLGRINTILNPDTYENTPDNDREIQRLCGEIIQELTNKPDTLPTLDLTKYSLFITSFSALKANHVFDRLFRISNPQTQLENLNELINPQKWTEETKLSYITTAITNNNTDNLKWIFEHLTMTPETRKQAVILAASLGHGEIVTALLASGAIISDSDRGEAVRSAAKNGHAQIVTALLANGSISDSARGESVNNAALNGHAQIVTALLANGSISAYYRGLAVNNAAKNGHAEIVTALLANGSISEDHRGQAVILAAENRHTEIVTALLANGSISNSDRGEAVKNAAATGHAQILTSLLASGSISDRDRGHSVINAADNGHAQIVTSLLANGSISDIARGQAVKNAAQFGHAQIVTSLLANGSISEGDRVLAITLAARSGHANIVALLEAWQPPALPPARIPDRTYIQPEEFAEHPELYLRTVAEEGLPIGVTFLNPDGREQAGIDAGGLTKQFICQLAEHLLLKEVIERDDLRFPRSSKEDLIPYTQLGKLLSHIERANATRIDSLYIGEIFDPRTYALLQILAKPNNPSESEEVRKEKEFLAIANTIATHTTQPLVTFLNISDPSEADIAKVKEYLEVIQGAPLSEPITTQELRTLCFELLQIKDYHRPLSAILTGVSDALRGKILTQGLNIAKSLQGEIDARLLDKFTLTSEDPIVAQKLAWIKEKITSELTDPEKTWIKRFLKCVSSQSVIPSTGIEIRESSDTMCHAHTCFCQLDLPGDSTSKELFFERLELLMAEQGFGLT